MGWSGTGIGSHEKTRRDLYLPGSTRLWPVCFSLQDSVKRGKSHGMAGDLATAASRNLLE